MSLTWVCHSLHDATRRIIWRTKFMCAIVLSCVGKAPPQKKKKNQLPNSRDPRSLLQHSECITWHCLCAGEMWCTVRNNALITKKFHQNFISNLSASKILISWSFYWKNVANKLTSLSHFFFFAVYNCSLSSEVLRGILHLSPVYSYMYPVDTVAAPSLSFEGSFVCYYSKSSQ